MTSEEYDHKDIYEIRKEVISKSKKKIRKKNWFNFIYLG